MRAEYGITANEQAVIGSTPLKNVLVEQELEGQKYQGVELIVASKQTGGLEYRTR